MSAIDAPTTAPVTTPPAASILRADHATALPVTLRNVGRTFLPRRQSVTGHTVLADVSLTIDPGEIIALIGTSGCGKSTLLRQVSGLDTPSTGSITIGDVPVTGIDGRCAVGFQEPRLLPWRTVGKNVELGLPPGFPRGQRNSRVAELLTLVGLEGAIRLRPRQISGGMAQRASLARALARNPSVLLLDEPFGALDALTRLQMQSLLLEIHRQEPTTVVLVTHDVDEALSLADRVVLLGRGSSAAGPASIQEAVAVPGVRPRDPATQELGALRRRLLTGLGVPPAR